MKQIITYTLPMVLSVYTSCKPKQNGSEGKTLDNFVSSKSGSMELNQCKGSLEKLNLLVKVLKDKQMESFSIENNRQRDIDYSQSGFMNENELGVTKFREVLSAVPQGILGAFFVLGGKIKLDKKTHSICEHYSTTGTNKPASATQYQELTEKIPACWLPGTDHAGFDLYIDSSTDENGNYKWIEHATVRAFGYIYSELLMKYDFQFSNGKTDLKIIANGAIPQGQQELITKTSEKFKIDLNTKNSAHSDRSRNFTLEYLESKPEEKKLFVFAEAFDSYFCNEKTRQKMEQNFPETYKVFASAIGLFAVENYETTFHQGLAQANLTTFANLSTITPVPINNVALQSTTPPPANSNEEKPGFFSNLFSTIFDWGSKLANSQIGQEVVSTLKEAATNKIRTFVGLPPKTTTSTGTGEINEANCRSFYTDGFDIVTFVQNKTNEEKGQILTAKQQCDQKFPWKVSCDYYTKTTHNEADYAYNASDSAEVTAMKTSWRETKIKCAGAGSGWKTASCVEFLKTHSLTFKPTSETLTTTQKQEEEKLWNERKTTCNKQLEWKSGCTYFDSNSTAFHTPSDGLSDADKLAEKKEFDDKKATCLAAKNQKSSSTVATTPSQQAPTTAQQPSQPQTQPREFKKSDSGGCGTIGFATQSSNWFMMLFMLLSPLVLKIRRKNI